MPQHLQCSHNGCLSLGRDERQVVVCQFTRQGVLIVPVWCWKPVSLLVSCCSLVHDESSGALVISKQEASSYATEQIILEAGKTMGEEAG